MEDNRRADVSISELIEDLDKKINDLNEAVSYSEQEAQDKCALVRNKVVTVLCSAKEEVLNLANEKSDAEELKEAVQLIRDRSASLYEEAIKRINEFNGRDIASLLSKEEVLPEPQVIEESVEERHEMKKKTGEQQAEMSEVTRKALDVLKGWLSPDGDVNEENNDL